MRILKWPDEFLRKSCDEVVTFDQKLKELSERMIDVMRESQGIGLAAPQVGVNKRMFVTEQIKENFPYIFINPKIISKSGFVLSTEGCLSIPGIIIEVKRSQKITMTAQDLNGKFFTIDASDLYSIVLQHEFDHLNGITMLDR